MSEYFVAKPGGECFMELVAWCRKWGGIEARAKIKTIEVSALSEDVCLIACELYAIEQSDG